MVHDQLGLSHKSLKPMLFSPRRNWQAPDSGYTTQSVLPGPPVT